MTAHGSSWRGSAAGVLGAVLLAACQPSGTAPPVEAGPTSVGPETSRPTVAATTSPALPVPPVVPRDPVPMDPVPIDPMPGAACGVERWAVKTGTDAAARSVDLTPRDTTVAALSALPAPAEPGPRVAPAETTVYRVHALLTDYKAENDSDDHLVLLDPGGAGTLVAEIPSPSCVGPSSAFLPAIARARAAFEGRFTAGGRYRRTSVDVTVTGVGFFDRVHGQRGVAANGVELHPVLSITFG